MTSVPGPGSRSAPSAAIVSPAVATAPAHVPAGVTTFPPLTMRSSFMVACPLTLLTGEPYVRLARWGGHSPRRHKGHEGTRRKDHMKSFVGGVAWGSRSSCPSCLRGEQPHDPGLRLRPRVPFGHLVPRLIVLPRRPPDLGLGHDPVPPDAAEALHPGPSVRRVPLEESVESREQPLDDVRPHR